MRRPPLRPAAPTTNRRRRLHSGAAVVGVRVVAIALACAMTSCGGEPAADNGERALPSSLQRVPNDEEWARERRELVLQRARSAPPTKIVFVGDSITEEFESTGEAAWRKHLEPLGVLNLGCTGDRTEHVLWRLEEAPLTRLAPRHVVLLLGTNNLGHRTSTPAETVSGLVAVIDTIQHQCPRAVLHLHEIFPRDATYSPMRGDVLQVNQTLRAIVAAANMRDADGTKLRLHAFGDTLVDVDGSIPRSSMADGLHLTATSYERWARALLAALTP
jgi:lysophospholipase L1-like esterase